MVVTNVPEHVGMWPRDPHARLLGEAPEPPGGGMPVHACAAIVEQDRAGAPGADCAVNGPPDRWRQRYQDHLAAFATDSQHPVTVFLANVTDVRAGRFEDPQAEQTEHGHQGEVIPVSGLAGCGEQGLELEVGEAERW
jgi:hypothetical protein